MIANISRVIKTNCPILLFLIASLFFSIKYLKPKSHLDESEESEYKTWIPQKAYILSAYFYPHSKSLGNNSLAFVMTMNLGRHAKYHTDMTGLPNTTEIMVMARNESSGVVVSAKYERITPHDNCQMVSVFAVVQILPNPEIISMASGGNLTAIPFKVPSQRKRDVVVCISPIYVSEQWQNFLLAAHIYKQFGAHMHVYLISAVTSLFELMQEYEKSNYITIQPWDRVKFPFVPDYIADTHSQVEFQNMAAAQTDCLLQYKETAEFITLFDLTDILIPSIAPTLIEEFQIRMKAAENSSVAYLNYRSQNYEATAFTYSAFSINATLSSLKEKNTRFKPRRIVLNPQKLNYTGMYRPSASPYGMGTLEVHDNEIIRLKSMVWNDFNETNPNAQFQTPPILKNYKNDVAFYERAIAEIEMDLQKALKGEKVSVTAPNLPNFYIFYDLVKNCVHEGYYKNLHSNNEVIRRKTTDVCPGPQLCAFFQHPDVKCVHVNSIHRFVPAAFPITYYFPTDIYFSSDVGCYPQ